MSTYNAAKSYSMTGVPGSSEVYLVTSTTASPGHPKAFWSQWFMPPRNQYTDLPTAYARTTGGINEVILISPEATNLSATLTWAKNLTHLVGMSATARAAQRSRIDQAVTCSPMITVSGTGNYFKNINLNNGLAVTDLASMNVTGNDNTFENVTITSPTIAAQAQAAGYTGLGISGTNNYFKNCTIGAATIARNQATPNVTIAPPSTGFGYTCFEDCMFWLGNGSSASPTFFNVLNTTGVTWVDFINCRFVALSTNMATAITYAFTFSTGGADATFTFDNRCSFVGIGAITAAANYGRIWLGPGALTDKMKSVILS